MNLITLADFAPYAELSSNIEQKAIDPYILQAQISDLKPVLGDIFYQDLVVNFANANYQELLNGKLYTVPNANYQAKFEGIKPMLCYWSYARYVKRASFKPTMSGMVAKTTQFSEPLSESTLLRLANESMSMAGVYQQGLEMFLYYNRASYPVIDSVFNLPVSDCRGSIWSIFQRDSSIKSKIRISSTR